MVNRLAMTPNHIEVWGDSDGDGVPDVMGEWFDTDHYSTWPGDPTPAYDGNFMPATETRADVGLTTIAECEVQAKALGKQLKAHQLAQRLIIPMDARVELYDRVSILDVRGVS